MLNSLSITIWYQYRQHSDHSLVHRPYHSVLYTETKLILVSHVSSLLLDLRLVLKSFFQAIYIYDDQKLQSLLPYSLFYRYILYFFLYQFMRELVTRLYSPGKTFPFPIRHIHTANIPFCVKQYFSVAIKFQLLSNLMHHYFTCCSITQGEYDRRSGARTLTVFYLSILFHDTVKC